MRQGLLNDNSINMPYLDYLVPGILAQSMLFISIFFGIALIWERDAGILHKILVSPTPRYVLVVGRAISAGIRVMPHVLLVYFLSYLIGINLRLEILAILGTILQTFLGAAIFGTFSLIFATIVKKRERFMGVGQVLAMPIFFASSALYPTSSMPSWLKLAAKLNPFSCQVDAIRNYMISSEATALELCNDYIVSATVLVILIFIASYRYPKMLD